MRRGCAIWLVALALCTAADPGEDAADQPPPLPGVEVSEQHSRTLTHVWIRNTNLAEITARLDYALTNLTTNVDLPLEIVCAPGESQRVFTLRPVDYREPWGYRRQYWYVWGSPSAEHESNAVYRLPFAPGVASRVAEGPGGAFSHFGESRHAVDFELPLGSPVHAARGGRVVLVRDGFGVGKPEPEYRDRVNILYIRHDDGTIGEYGHLQSGGFVVRLGDRVAAGDVVARSGQSGFVRGPYLHFMVFRARSGTARESVPLRFRAVEGEAVVLEEGRSYTATDGSP